MTGIPIAFAIFITATVYIVGQLCFFAYDASATRKKLRHRLELFAVRLRQPDHGDKVDTSDAPPQVLISDLRGDDLEFARELGAFHVSPGTARRLFLVLRICLAAVLAGALVFVGHLHSRLDSLPSLIGLGIIGMAIGWAIPHAIVNRLMLSRRHSIAQGLPDAIELLVIAVEAGLSLEEGINRTVVELYHAQPAIAEELAITSADLRVLPNREDALRRLAERVNLPSVQSVLTTLSQTMRYGTPLAEALRVVAAELRNDALMKLEEQVNRLPVLMTIPMILFILPSLFLIIGGPAFLKVLDVLSHYK